MPLTGTKALSKKLDRLGTKMGFRVLNKAVRQAATPVMRQVRQRAPVGNNPHRTYKGRLVSGGFLKRSVRLKVRQRRRKGLARAELGVLKEAFYGVQFLDKGISVDSRRARKGRARNSGRRSRKIKPYRIAGRSWFERIFVANRRKMESKLTDTLSKEIDRAIT